MNEEMARQIKATSIALELMARGVDHEEASYLSEQGWEAAAALAKVRPASWKTREVVIGLLERHDQARQRMAEISAPLELA